MSIHQIPEWLSVTCEPSKYLRWLSRKAATHYKRDRARHSVSQHTLKSYKIAIHNAVIASGGNDAYTGSALDWTLLSTYKNSESSLLRREYKHSLANLPTVDHVGDGSDQPEFRICSWRVNDAKHDLPYDDFVELCRSVVKFADGTPTGPAAAAI